MNTQEMSVPAFFVFFNHEWCTEKLTIPTSFARCIQEKLPELVVLRDQQNNMWRVGVENEGDDICFQAGWTTFTNDVLLHDGDFILFEYSFAGLFNVKLFDLSSCEKKGAQKFVFKDIEWNNEIRAGNERERVRVEEYMEAVGEEGMEGEEETWEEDGNEEQMNGVGMEGEEETWEEDGNEELDEEQMNGVGMDGADMEVEVGDKEVLGEDGIIDGAISEKKSRNKRILDIYGGKLFRFGLAVKPNNPYFLTKVRSRKGELYIPLDFLEHSGINFAQVTYLVCSDGGEWRVKYKRWKDGRTMYSGGWRSFCLAYMVDKDDVCICEFITGSRGLYIKASIVRRPSIDL